MPALEVRALPVARLIPAPYNPRRDVPPTSDEYQKLRASLVAFGLVEPLVWNETTGHLVGGHLRLRVLKELGHTEVPVAVVRLPLAREMALNVVLNNRDAQGCFEPERLAAVLAALNATQEYDLTGFEPSALAVLEMKPDALAPETNLSGRVEVVLVTDDRTYSLFARKLDALVTAHGLVAHVRRF
jgi:ParB-like chromosome segregation protein Spo0J